MTNVKLKNDRLDIKITGDTRPEFTRILTDEALQFVAELHLLFAGRVKELLKARKARQDRIRNGELPDFLSETKHIREDSSWRIAAIPEDLQDRRVEITGPVERKMVINALNSGAKVFMADFEDSHTPTWEGTIEGQINLRDAIDGAISYTSPEGKNYSLNKEIAVLIVRPRGWHLYEKHMMVEGEKVPGAIFDFGLYFFHNAKKLIEKGTGPYFYIPKLESHKEARLWNDIFTHAEKALGLKIGTIKATVLIETIVAAFEMEEILYELRNHIVGLNCGRWDYIFSFIKKFSHDPAFILPDRTEIVMTTHFLKSYSLLLIKTCHKRGAFAMGGMSAFIPVKNDEVLNAKAIEQVRKDKEREAGDGHDGTWVAHPGLIPVAREVFDRLMPTPNQLHNLRSEVNITSEDLLKVHKGNITENGVRNNISVSLQYIESWLRGIGCVPIFNLMEDAATAEIARTQLWQWVKHKAVLSDGREITPELYKSLKQEELAKIKSMVSDKIFASGKYREASEFLDTIVLNPEFEEFLTLRAYQQIS